MELLELYNKKSATSTIMSKTELLDDVACEWLNHDIDIPIMEYGTTRNQVQPWYLNFPVTVRNSLYIGKI